MMFGVGEPTSARVEHLLGVRDLQDATGGFTAFIPWTFQDSGTDLEGEVEPSGGYDYLRTLAISRLALDNVDHVQGSWVTQGPKIGQLSLFFGADDLGSIMLEENVVAAAGAQVPDDPERHGADYSWRRATRRDSGGPSTNRCDVRREFTPRSRTAPRGGGGSRAG